VRADAEVVRDRGGDPRRDPYTGREVRRPELVAARAALPAGTGSAGYGDDGGDPGAGRGGGPGGGNPGGSGAGGGGARAESIDSHGYVQPQVVDGEIDGDDYVIPSKIHEQGHGNEGATFTPPRPETTDNDGGA
jgi:hypothetical protein